MEEQGRGEAEVFRELGEALSKDVPEQHILCSMCPPPHPVAARAHALFLRTNLGDPGLYQGTRGLERKVVGWLGELLHHPRAVGYVSSGGTEGNIQALAAFRELRPDVARPNVVLPASGHFSFDKAGRMLGVELRRARLDHEFRADPSHVGELVDRNTIGVVGVAGTTELGQVDSIAALAKIALEESAFLHVDAAFGGYVLPFLPEPPKFDFAVAGVSSVTVDPHKMGLSTIPSGCILFREQRFMEAISVPTPYLTSQNQSSLVGTRSGASAAAAYAVIRHLGMEGFRANVERCMAVTRWLADRVRGMGLSPVIPPQMNILAFYVDDKPGVQRRLEERGWYVSVVTGLEAVRLVVMPQTTREVAEAFADDLAEAL